MTENSTLQQAGGTQESFERLEVLYKRQCEYSDYLDKLQRSSQRYYLLGLAGSIGLMVTIFNVLFQYKRWLALDSVLSLAEWGAPILVAFGMITIVQLASLRASNLSIDRKIQALEYGIAQHTSMSHLFSVEEADVRTKNRRVGNDWAKAMFVSLGNGLCILAYYNRFETGSLVLLSVLMIAVSLLVFQMISYRRSFGSPNEDENNR